MAPLRHIGTRYLYLLRVHSTRWRRAWHVRLPCREDGIVEVARGTLKTEVAQFRNIVFTKRTAENGLPDTEGSTVLAFLWRAHAQSGFKEGIRRMQRDQKPGDSAMAS
jgi:hypothetical protein